jgi:hypothetical protein
MRAPLAPIVQVLALSTKISRRILPPPPSVNLAEIILAAQMVGKKWPFSRRAKSIHPGGPPRYNPASFHVAESGIPDARQPMSQEFSV